MKCMRNDVVGVHLLELADSLHGLLPSMHSK